MFMETGSSSGVVRTKRSLVCAALMMTALANTAQGEPFYRTLGDRRLNATPDKDLASASRTNREVLPEHLFLQGNWGEENDALRLGIFPENQKAAFMPGESVYLKVLLRNLADIPRYT